MGIFLVSTAIVALARIGLWQLGAKFCFDYFLRLLALPPSSASSAGAG
jgi:hypothetical protein